MPSRTGLSPLARGTQHIARDGRVHIRFIPAGAGNTQTSFCLRILLAVYPRWRGEHGGRGVSGSVGDGLSPLARGTRKLRYAIPQIPRFIPAGAGNTTTDHSYPLNDTVYPRWRGEHWP